MNHKLYRQIARTNLKKNRYMLLPYYISCIIVIMMLYTVNALIMAPGLKSISGGNFTIDVMKLGSHLFSLLTAFFLFYTNSFIMKRRKKELGLYHILGMEKRHIRKVLQYEHLFSTVAIITVGIISGMIFNPLITMLLSKIIGQSLGLLGVVSWITILKTSLLFLIIFFVLHLYDLRQVKKANPIELLHASSQGEKEPKSNLLLVVLGVGTLVLGYFLALTVKNPKNETELTLIIVAVISVVVATYLLFLAVSIAIWKFLKSRENIYYQSKYFTLISGMLYRMKQNGIGLANICILCTSTLFVMTTTVSLYLGVENVIHNNLAHDVYTSDNGMNYKKLQAFFTESSERHSVKIEDEITYSGAKYTRDLNGDGTKEFFFLMPLGDYNRLVGKNIELNEDEVFIFAEKGQVGNTLNVDNTHVTVKEKLKEFPVKNNVCILLVVFFL